MYIVGTSGHIDHGKTSLIKALTDIDCDRLPEEKEREMTIDIGFASINYPKFGTVSIIDVPGHERFIRNMVVGAWGIDLALLLVSIDDGWMPQTEDHFMVLQLLNIERIIVVLNKIDLGDRELIDMVREDVAEKFSGTKYMGSSIVETSARTGAGIENLKAEILANLKKLKKAPATDKPYMYIDRVFASKGYGTIITGTLKNGTFNDDDTVNILPVMKNARIKRIESHNSTLTEGNPSQRTALNLSGMAVDELKRGYIICKKNFFSESKDILAEIQLLVKGKIIKNNLEIELLIGASAIRGKIILLRDVKEDVMRFPVRLKFSSPWHFYPGEPFVLTSPGGFRIIGGGRVLFPDYSPDRHKVHVKELLKKIDSGPDYNIYELVLDIYQWIKKDDYLSLFPEGNKTLTGKLAELEEGNKILVKEEFIFNHDFYFKSLDVIRDIADKNIGLNLKEISDLAGIDSMVCRVLLGDIIEDNGILEKDGRYFAGRSITEDTLSGPNKKILSDVLKNGKMGIELDRAENDQMKKGIKELIKLDFLVSLDGNIIYHRSIYEEMKNDIMKALEKSDRLSMPDAKEAAGVSRKFIIPLLNRIERDGLIKRIGDFRMKA